MSDIPKSLTNLSSKQKICRICGKESEQGQILFHSNRDIENRAVEICSYILIQLKYVRFYPNWICPGCELQLESTSQFFELIRNGQKFLCEQFGEPPRRGRKPKIKELTPLEDVSKSKDEPVLLEDSSKRTPKTPIKLKDVMKGDELEELYTTIGLTRKRQRLMKSKAKLIAHIESEEGLSLGEMLAIPGDPQRIATRYQCIVCKELFCIEAAFFKHVATHKNIQYECTDCEQSFSTKELFDNHQISENHKGLGIIETPYDTITNNDPSKSVEKNPLPLEAARELITVPGKTNKKQTTTCYKCFKCSKSFSTKQSMQRHQVTHSTARPFKCEFCPATFKQTSTLAVHRNSHTKERRFKCNKCTKTFIYRQTLKAHLRIHDGLKPYICPVCKKGFRQMVNLVEHKRIHTGERPYVCLICGSAFKTSSQCRNHQKVHKTSDERPPELFRVNSTEKTHSCKLCGKLFSQKSAMVKHLRTHTGEKPYVCYMCPKSFADPSNFKKHKRVHAKQKEQQKIKSVSLLKRSQPQNPSNSVPDPKEPGIGELESSGKVLTNCSLMELLDDDNDRTSKRWGLLRESSDPIITEIRNDDDVAESMPTLSNQLVCVSYQDPMNPVTSKTTFYVVN